MTRDDILKEYDAQMRLDRPGGPTYRVEKAPYVTRVVSDTPGAEFGAILYSALSERNADPVIDEEKKHFASLGLPLEWKLYAHDKPRDLGDRLANAGFRPGDPETVLCHEIKTPTPASPPQGVKITKLTRPGELEALRHFESSAGGPGSEALIVELSRELRDAPDRLSVFVAWMNGRPASKGWVRYYPGREFADLWGGETVPELRGRGIYKALVGERLKEAQAKGVRYLVTDALPTSRPILEKLGFQTLTTTTPYTWLPL